VALDCASEQMQKFQQSSWKLSNFNNNNNKMHGLFLNQIYSDEDLFGEFEPLLPEQCG
jgi:hypothetical protein